MNLQRLFDQHPAAFAAIFPIYFFCLWLLVGATFSIIGGWFSLAKVYRTQMEFDGAKWRMQSGRMRGLANYNHVLTIGVSPQGLYLASMFLFRFMHLRYLCHGARSRFEGPRAGCSSTSCSPWDMILQSLCGFAKNWRRSIESRLAPIGRSRRRERSILPHDPLGPLNSSVTSPLCLT